MRERKQKQVYVISCNDIVLGVSLNREVALFYKEHHPGTEVLAYRAMSPEEAGIRIGAMLQFKATAVEEGSTKIKLVDVNRDTDFLFDPDTGRIKSHMNFEYEVPLGGKHGHYITDSHNTVFENPHSPSNYLVDVYITADEDQSKEAYIAKAQQLVDEWNAKQK